jgi:hypothetical protein
MCQGRCRKYRGRVAYLQDLLPGFFKTLLHNHFSRRDDARRGLKTGFLGPRAGVFLPARSFPTSAHSDPSVSPGRVASVLAPLDGRDRAFAP